MRYIKLATQALALTLLGTAVAGFGQGYGPQQYPQQQGYGQQGYGPPPPPRDGYGQGGWDAPPPEFRDVARQGFHDGIFGAQRDIENHRRPDPNNRDEFRHPKVPGYLRRDYKMGFRRGYDVGIQHAFGGGNGYGPPRRPY